MSLDGKVEFQWDKRKQLISECLNAIKRADIVFAWIDDLACYGTISEMAYAHTIGKTVWVGIADKVKWFEMWFVFAAHANRAVVHSDAQACLKCFCVEAGLIQFDKTHSNGLSDWRTLPDGKEKRNAYYCSEGWDELRCGVIERAGGMCELCGMSQIYAVHHLTYVRLYNERLEDLQGLCEECHDRKHQSRRKYA